MMRKLFLSIILAWPSMAQIPSHGLTAVGGGTWDLSAAGVLRMKIGTGVPPSTSCDEAGEVGSLTVRSDAQATNASLYVCSQTGVGTYAWELAQGGGGSGTVTSVALSAPSTIFSVSGSPVTDNGTLALSYATGQTANQVIGTSAAGAVGLLALTDDHIPDTITASNYQPLDAALTALAAGSDFVQFTGPTTATKTFTLPDASSTILTTNAAVTAAQGGTGDNTGGTTGVPRITAGDWTYDAALENLGISPLTTRGDILTVNATPAVTRLGIGAAKKALYSDGTDLVYQFTRFRSHATDCTALTDGEEGEACYEQDAETLYVCEPTAGLCDTPAEWRAVSGGTGFTVAGTGLTSTGNTVLIDTALTPQKDAANVFTAGSKQTFTPSASTAGLRIVVGANPDTPATGDVSINDTTNILQTYTGTVWNRYTPMPFTAGGKLLYSTSASATAEASVCGTGQYLTGNSSIPSCAVINASQVLNAIDLTGSGDFTGLTEKVSPASADLLVIEDSAASGAKKKVQVGNLPSGGGAPTSATYITQTPDGTLSAEQALSALTTGMMASTTTTGVVATRVLTGTSNEISISNGDGSGNPTFSIPATFDLAGKTATRPFVASIFSSFPGTCTANQDYRSRTDPGTAGQSLYVCNSGGNGWDLVGDGGGGGGAPGGSDGEVQYRVNGTTFGGVTGSAVNGADIRVGGTVTASATRSLFGLGAAIAGGSANGTYFGANFPSGFTGNLIDWQFNSNSVMKADYGQTAADQYTLLLYNATPTTALTQLRIRAGATQGSVPTPMISLYNSGGSERGRIGLTGGDTLFIIDNNGRGFEYNVGLISIHANGNIPGVAFSTASLAGGADVALWRNAAGVLEVNDNSQNGFRDLKLRDLYVTGSSGTPNTNNVKITTTATAARTWTLPDATDTFVGKDTTDTLTNKTIDVEGTNNVITTVSKIWLDAVSCNGTTGSLNWDTLTTQAPTTSCTAGSTNTNLMRGVAVFADAATAQMQRQIMLPSDWTGAIDIGIKWRSPATTGNVVWQVSTVCIADAEVDDAAWNTASTVTDLTKGTASQTNDALITGLTTTGCAASELMHLRILRDPAHASDDLNNTANLIGVMVTMRRAQ